jgi:hypothetical protein
MNTQDRLDHFGVALMAYGQTYGYKQHRQRLQK